MFADLLKQARRASGLSQADVAFEVGTSRATLSAYEHGHKSPTVRTVERILEPIGYELTVTPRIEFTEHVISRGRVITVLSHLPRLPLAQAFADVVLPLHLNWSAPGQVFKLANRHQRSRVYQIVLREGLPADFMFYIDGALLVDLWDELILPDDVRHAWDPVIADTSLEPA